MIRHKYETTTTGTGNLTVTVPIGFSSDVSTVRTPHGTEYGGAQVYPYVLVDGNGTDWEHGYGVLATSTFTRTTVVESTNAGSAINLSANTHTVFVEESSVAGTTAFLTLNMALAGGPIATGVTETVTLSSLNTYQSASHWPGYSAPTLPATSLNLSSILPYHKGYRITMYIGVEGTVDGHVRFRLSGDGNYVSAMYTHTVITHATDPTYAVITTPVIDGRCPFNSSTNDNLYPGALYLLMDNQSSANANMSGTFRVDYRF